MCMTWFHISYCQACNAYIDSHRVGTVFCGRNDANLPCEAKQSIDESPVPGPCTTCQPPPRLRRSQRLWMQSRKSEARTYDEDPEEDEASDDETDRDTIITDASEDNSDDGNGSTGGDYLNDGDYMPTAPKEDDKNKTS